MKKISDEILNDYIDNQLDASAVNELKHSLNEDEESLKKLQALKTVDDVLHDIEVYPAPNNFTESFMEKLFNQVKSIKPVVNYFFIGIVSVFGLIITAVLVAVWIFAGKQKSSTIDLPVIDTLKNFVNENIASLGNLLSSNQLVFAGGFLTIILFLSILFLFDSHKNFKNKLKSITQ